jgi:TolA-binding protein
MRRAGVPLLGAALCLSACVATQKDVLDIENQTDNLKVQITDLKSTISSMQANQADLSVQMKQLHDDLTAFNETIKENQDQMTRLSSKLDDMSATIASKVASIGTTLTTQQAKGLNDQKAELDKQAAAIAAQASQTNPTDLFTTADQRLQVKSYSLAVKGFEEYISKFPQGALIDVAIYKLGDAYFGERKWESAGREFAIVLEKYPKSEMTASARLKYALCLISMKKNYAEARQYLESIPSDFPTLPEAKAAERELKRLGAKGQAKAQ